MNLQRSVSKIIVLSFVLLSNTVSFGMVLFDVSKLSKDIKGHIFVVANTFTKNQLKFCSEEWHAIGTKKSPNMYELINNESLTLSHDDWCYMMMHAALDKNIAVMEKILSCTNQRNFDCDFGGKRRFHLCDLFDFEALKLDSNNYQQNTIQKFKELDVWSTVKKQNNVVTPLVKACFMGDSDTIQQILHDRNASSNVPDESFEAMFTTMHERLNCFYIITYNNNPYCIQALSFPQEDREICYKTPLKLLYMAMSKQKKQAFEALVKNNVYGCLNDVRSDFASGEFNTTTLDELYKQTDIPNLNEYIELYRRLGGKDLKDMGFDYSDWSLESSSTSLICCTIL